MASHAEVLARQRQPAAVTRSARMRALSRVPLAAVLIVLAGLASWGIVLAPTWVPWSVFVPLAVAAGLFLSAAEMRLVLAVVFICFTISAVIVLTTGITKPNLPGTAIGFVVVVAMMVSVARSRARLGVQGGLGETMLVDLRDRLRVHGELPPLPASWHAESALYSAHGEAFSGDFVVADRTRTEDADRLEIGLFDVSGKGVGAGTRSLLLSGAFGGLLGAMQPPEFLPAANAYLLRQDWQEGFATAVHLSIDLDTGSFELRSAGHPPAVQLHAGSGRWGVHAADGPILGLMPDAEFSVVRGTLQRGDAMLLFTDGLVETPRRDISLGIDKLLGQSERLLRSGFEHGAHRLIDRVESMNDDRALFLLHRR